MDIPVVLLAGGLGTRLREETEFRPKPMVSIGGKPIILHIMRHYAFFGYRRFLVCLGYKGDILRDYFLNYHVHNSDFTVTLGAKGVKIHDSPPECDWSVTLAETGAGTNTGGRLKRVAKYIQGDVFMATYGDGVSNVNIQQLLAHHYEQGKLATVTAVRPLSRFGELTVRDGLASRFDEKTQVQNSWINGGFLVMQKSVLDIVRGDEDHLEADILGKLADVGQLAVYKHNGFWQCMDTLREAELLNRLWDEGDPPWAMRPEDGREPLEKPEPLLATASSGGTGGR
jgi:glucose-1-phosphate cytidylyltransferase